MGLGLARLGRRIALVVAGCCFVLARRFAWLFLATAENSQGEARENQDTPRQAKASYDEKTSKNQRKPDTTETR